MDAKKNQEETQKKQVKETTILLSNPNYKNNDPDVMSENLSSSEFLTFNYDDALIRKDSKESEIITPSIPFQYPLRLSVKGDDNQYIEDDSEKSDEQEEEEADRETSFEIKMEGTHNTILRKLQDFKDCDVPESCVDINDLVVPDFKVKFIKQISNKISENSKIYEEQ